MPRPGTDESATTVVDPEDLEHGELAQGSHVLDVDRLGRELDRRTAGSQSYGWLHEYRTGTQLRRATGEEFERAARAAIADGGSGVIFIGGLECTVIVDD